MDLDPFLFQGPLLVSVLFRANIDLFAAVFLIFLLYEMFSSASLVTIKRSLPLSRHKIPWRFPTLLSSQELCTYQCKARGEGGGGGRVRARDEDLSNFKIF